MKHIVTAATIPTTREAVARRLVGTTAKYAGGAGFGCASWEVICAVATG
jgi:hypothetical protein